MRTPLDSLEYIRNERRDRLYAGERCINEEK